VNKSSNDVFHETEKRFSEKHEWVSKEGSSATVGISEYAQESLGDVVYVQLPDVGAEFSSGGEFLSWFRI
jgi:glycine cleavage system H protein